MKKDTKPNKQLQTDTNQTENKNTLIHMQRKQQLKNTPDLAQQIETDCKLHIFHFPQQKATPSASTQINYAKLCI